MATNTLSRLKEPAHDRSSAASPPRKCQLFPGFDPIRFARRPLQRHRPPQSRPRKYRRHQRRPSPRRQILSSRLLPRPPQIPPPHARRCLHSPPRPLPPLPPQQRTGFQTPPLLAPHRLLLHPRPRVPHLPPLQRRQRRRHLRRPHPRPLPLLHPPLPLRLLHLPHHLPNLALRQPRLHPRRPQLPPRLHHRP